MENDKDYNKNKEKKSGRIFPVVNEFFGRGIPLGLAIVAATLVAVTGYYIGKNDCYETNQKIIAQDSLQYSSKKEDSLQCLYEKRKSLDSIFEGSQNKDKIFEDQKKTSEEKLAEDYLPPKEISKPKPTSKPSHSEKNKNYDNKQSHDYKEGRDKPREQTHRNKDTKTIVSHLHEDKNGKYYKINLVEKPGLQIYIENEEEAKLLMKVYDLAGRKWGDGAKATERMVWDTYVEAKNNFYRKDEKDLFKKRISPDCKIIYELKEGIDTTSVYKYLQLNGIDVNKLLKQRKEK